MAKDHKGSTNMDINEVAALFHIFEKSHAMGGSMSHIRDWAHDQLLEENAQLEPVVKEMRAKRQAKIEEEARARREETEAHRDPPVEPRLEGEPAVDEDPMNESVEVGEKDEIVPAGEPEPLKRRL